MANSKSLIGRGVYHASYGNGVVKGVTSTNIIVYFSKHSQTVSLQYPCKSKKKAKLYKITDIQVQPQTPGKTKYPDKPKLFNYLKSMTPGYSIKIRNLAEKIECNLIPQSCLIEMNEELLKLGKKLIIRNDEVEVFSKVQPVLEQDFYSSGDKTYSVNFKTTEIKEEKKYPIRKNDITDYRNSKYYKEISSENKIKKYSKFTLFVYSSLKSTRCNNNKMHVAEAVTLQTINIKGSQVRFNIFCCKECGKYFVDCETINRVLFENAFPLITIKDDTYPNDIYGNRAQESELTYYGYNAKKSGPSERERREILYNLIINGIITKQRCITILQNNISFNGKKSDCGDALKKWQSDLKYVSDFNIDNQLKIITPVISIIS